MLSPRRGQRAGRAAGRGGGTADARRKESCAAGNVRSPPATVARRDQLGRRSRGTAQRQAASVRARGAPQPTSATRRNLCCARPAITTGKDGKVDRQRSSAASTRRPRERRRGLDMDAGDDDRCHAGGTGCVEVLNASAMRAGISTPAPHATHRRDATPPHAPSGQRSNASSAMGSAGTWAWPAARGEHTTPSA